MAMKQKDLKSFGFLDIFKHSFKLIFSCPKIFMQITFLFILPISCINLANHLQLFPSHAIMFSMSYKTQIDSPTYYNTSRETLVGFPTYYNTSRKTLLGSPSYHNTSYQTPVNSPNYYNIPNEASSKNLRLHVSGCFSLPLKLVFLLPLRLLFSILYISTITYTIACILTHNQKEITIQKAMRVIPKAWKRLLVTSIFRSFIYFTIIAICILIIFLGDIIMVTYSHISDSLGQLIGICIGIIIVLLLFIGGVLYICTVWLLADVVSVVEKMSGMKALKKSKSLIKGKMGTTMVIFLVLFLCGLPNKTFVGRVKKNDVSIGDRIFYGILTLVWPTLVSLLGNVVSTILYFVCKAYHQEEEIETFPWVEYVEVSNVDYYLPLKMKEEQEEKL